MYRKGMFSCIDSSRSVLQIVHDFQFTALNVKQDLYDFPADATSEDKKRMIAKRIKRLTERGYAGLVLTVDNKNYLEDEEALERMAWAIDYASSLGMKLWIYDEQYYPTGAAGGLTLRNHPELQNMALACVEKDVKVDGAPVRIYTPMGHSPLKYAYAQNGESERIDISAWRDPAGNLCWDAPDGLWHIWCFYLRPLYEGTYLPVAGRAPRRYPNVADEKAMARFLDVTYTPYERVLKNRLGEKVDTVFTDEPSALWYSKYPEGRDPEIRSRIYSGSLAVSSYSIYDKPIIDMPVYPFVSWPTDIDKVFEKRCGYRLDSSLPDLFSKDVDHTRQIRVDFFSTLNAMFDRAYNDQFRERLARYPMQYSGHWIHEENFFRHPTIYGDILHNMGKMDIPGCDLLYSAPDRVRHAMAAKLASSAAHQYGRRHCMIEASNMCDEDQTFSVERIELAMAMIYALGVDTITSYYGEELFDENGYRRFADYTARLSMLLDDGIHVSQVAMFYPFEQLQAVAVVEKEQPHPKCDSIQGSVNRMHDALLSAQTDFDYINQEVLARCRFESGRILMPCGERPTSLIFPNVDYVPEPTAQAIRKAIAAGVRVLFDGAGRTIEGLDDLSGVEFVEECGLPACWDFCVEGEPQLVVYHRANDNQDVYLVVNTSQHNVEKQASIPGQSSSLIWIDLDNGTEENALAEEENGRVKFMMRIPALSAKVLVRIEDGGR